MSDMEQRLLDPMAKEPIDPFPLDQFLISRWLFMSLFKNDPDSLINLQIARLTELAWKCPHGHDFKKETFSRDITAELKKETDRNHKSLNEGSLLVVLLKRDDKQYIHFMKTTTRGASGNGSDATRAARNWQHLKGYDTIIDINGSWLVYFTVTSTSACKLIRNGDRSAGSPSPDLQGNGACLLGSNTPVVIPKIGYQFLVRIIDMGRVRVKLVMGMGTVESGIRHFREKLRMEQIVFDTLDDIRVYIYNHGNFIDYSNSTNDQGNEKDYLELLCAASKHSINQRLKNYFIKNFNDICEAVDISPVLGNILCEYLDGEPDIDIDKELRIIAGKQVYITGTGSRLGSSLSDFLEQKLKNKLKLNGITRRMPGSIFSKLSGLFDGEVDPKHYYSYVPTARCTLQPLGAAATGLSLHHWPPGTASSGAAAAGPHPLSSSSSSSSSMIVEDAGSP
jgi:hypothetical protein